MVKLNRSRSFVHGPPYTVNGKVFASEYQYKKYRQCLKAGLIEFKEFSLVNGKVVINDSTNFSARNLAS